MQLQYRLLPLFDAMVSQPEFPILPGSRRADARLGPGDKAGNHSPLSRRCAQQTQKQLSQTLSELSQWLPGKLHQLSVSDQSLGQVQLSSAPSDDFIDNIVREVSAATAIRLPLYRNEYRELAADRKQRVIIGSVPIVPLRAASVPMRHGIR
ncbi:MAG: hypothetical protein R3C56_39870 [Pirellulaceae bacterium]